MIRVGNNSKLDLIEIVQYRFDERKKKFALSRTTKEAVRFFFFFARQLVIFLDFILLFYRSKDIFKRNSSFP